MKGVYVSDFGEQEGVHTYRVNGDKEDLEKIINDIRLENAQFAIEPTIERSHGNYTMLLKLKVKVAATTE